MALKLTDELEIKQKNSGGQTITVPLSEVNYLISAEESDRLDALEARADDLEAMQTVNEAPIVAVQAEGIYQNAELAEITFTAIDGGSDSNAITISIAIPVTAEDRAISVDGSAITVSLATEESGEEIVVSDTETATAIALAITEHAEAGLIVSAAATGTGSTVLSAEETVEMAGGTDGSMAMEGQLYIDADNDKIYVCIAETDGTELVLDDNWKTATLTAIVTE